MEKKAAPSEIRNERLGGKHGLFKGNCAGFSFPPEGEADNAGRKSEGKPWFKLVWQLVVLCSRQQAHYPHFPTAETGSGRESICPRHAASKRRLLGGESPNTAPVPR